MPLATRQPSGSGPALELTLIAVFVLCWVLFFALAFLGYPLAGTLPLGLYAHYGAAAALGWILGNVFVQRARAWAGGTRIRLVLALLFSPGGLFYLTWSFEDVTLRSAVPLEPLYAHAIFVVFFLVPVSFRGAALWRSD